VSRALKDFEQEVREWISVHAPASLYGTRKGRFDGFWGGRKAQEPSRDVRRWLEACIERGWTAPTWPTEYGGGGLAREEAEILEAELVRLKLPPPLVGFGLTMLGPTLLDFGTEAQKQTHIPPIVQGKTRWCQGYSEPGAGSDLASLQMKATLEEGDRYLVNGQKVWTSHADKSDWIFCLVRTDTTVKKQAGITFLLVDMASEGVSVRRIPLISGQSPFCEVFFEDVRVPTDHVVDEVNKGWTVAKALMRYERTMIGAAMGGTLSDMEQKLVGLARRHLEASEGSLPDAHLRSEIARNAMEARCFDLTLQRIAQNLAEGQPPGPESSILKLCASELKQRRWSLAAEIAGTNCLGWDAGGFSTEDLGLTREWLRSRANTIEGGSSEIQLNVIAKRVLGLPK